VDHERASGVDPVRSSENRKHNEHRCVHLVTPQRVDDSRGVDGDAGEEKNQSTGADIRLSLVLAVRAISRCDREHAEDASWGHQQAEQVPGIQPETLALHARRIGEQQPVAGNKTKQRNQRQAAGNVQ